MSNIDILRNSFHDPNEFCQQLSGILDGLGTEVNPTTAPAALGTQAALVGVDGTGNNAAPVTTTQSRLAALESKVDAIIAALKTTGVLT